MPFAGRWYNDDKTVICYEFTGKLTVEDLDKLTDLHHEMLNSVDYPVHMMLDWQRCEGIPPNIINYARNLLAQRQHPRTGATVMIGMRLELRIFFGAFERAIRFVIKTPRFLMADTQERGYTLLMEVVEGEK